MLSEWRIIRFQFLQYLSDVDGVDQISSPSVQIMNSELKGTSGKKSKRTNHGMDYWELRAILIYQKSHLVCVCVYVHTHTRCVCPSEFHDVVIPLSFTKNYGLPILPIGRSPRECSLSIRWKIAAAYQRLCSRKQCCSRGNNEGLGKAWEPSPKRFSALSSTSERFTRSIARVVAAKD